MSERPAPKYMSASAPVRSWRIAPDAAWTAAGLCWLAFAAVAVMVLSGNPTAFDSAGLLFWRSGPLMLPRGPVWLLEMVRDITALGGILLRNAIALLGVGALLALRMRREAYGLIGTVVSGWLVESALKLLVGRPRPMIVPHLTEAGGASFPSGHSFNAALVYVALALAFAALSARRTVRWGLIGGALALSMAIALSRVWLGVHFPSDAVAGWSAGSAWAFTAAALLARPAAVAALAADAA